MDHIGSRPLDEIKEVSCTDFYLKIKTSTRFYIKISKRQKRWNGGGGASHLHLHKHNVGNQLAADIYFSCFNTPPFQFSSDNSVQ